MLASTVYVAMGEFVPDRRKKIWTPRAYQPGMFLLVMKEKDFLDILVDPYPGKSCLEMCHEQVIGLSHLTYSRNFWYSQLCLSHEGDHDE